MNPQTNPPQPPLWTPNYSGNAAVPTTDTHISGTTTQNSTSPQSAYGPQPFSNMLPTPTPVSAAAPGPQMTQTSSFGQPGGVSTQLPAQSNNASQPQQSVMQPISGLGQITSPSVQDEAADSVLDEEWVEKAKEVIARTKSDPYAQGQELAKIKAQYIKSRYNKDIKVGDI